MTKRTFVKVNYVLYLRHLGFIFMLSLIPSCLKKVKTQYPLSDHFNGQLFFNPKSPQGHDKTFFDFLKWQFNKTQIPWPNWRENTPQTGELWKEAAPDTVQSTFIGHVTHLIQFRGLNILTDPHFSHRAGPYSTLGPRRHRDPAMGIDQLPPIHVVFIGHNHYDHMDGDSISSLTKKFNPVFIVPIGNKEKLLSLGANLVIELDWWEKTSLQGGGSLTVVPSEHWSRRGLFDTNKALWGGMVVEYDNFKVYFASDTAYEDHFKEIHRRFGPMDLAHLPIGAYEPRWFMKAHHMNPEDALLAHGDLKARQSIGNHFGTFQLTDEGIDDPANTLKQLMFSSPPQFPFHVPNVGETFIIHRQSQEKI